MEIVYAFKKAATECSIDSFAEPRVAWVEAEPASQEGKAALDEQTLDLMKEAGFARDRELHPATFEAIRNILITKTYMRVAYNAAPDAKLCLDKWFDDNKFTTLAPDQPIPSGLR